MKLIILSIVAVVALMHIPASYGSPIVLLGDADGIYGVDGPIIVTDPFAGQVYQEESSTQSAAASSKMASNSAKFVQGPNGYVAQSINQAASESSSSSSSSSKKIMAAQVVQPVVPVVVAPAASTGASASSFAATDGNSAIAGAQAETY